MDLCNILCTGRQLWVYMHPLFREVLFIGRSELALPQPVQDMLGQVGWLTMQPFITEAAECEGRRSNEIA